MQQRKVDLRAERDGADSRFLWAYLGDDGSLHIDGQDLGPSTAIVSSDGEYEWFSTIASTDVPRVVALLGGAPGADILELLAERYCGAQSYEVERLLRESDIPIERMVWSG